MQLLIIKADIQIYNPATPLQSSKKGTKNSIPQSGSTTSAWKISILVFSSQVTEERSPAHLDVVS